MNLLHHNIAIVLTSILASGFGLYLQNIKDEKEGICVDDKALWLILGGGLVTFLPRWLPIVALKNARIPIWFQKMDELPSGIGTFAALIASISFLGGHRFPECI